MPVSAHNNSRMHRFRRAAAALAALCACLAFTGCSHQRMPVRLLIGADVSGSMDKDGPTPQRRQYLGVMEQGVSALPRDNTVGIWMYDTTANLLFPPAPVSDPAVQLDAAEQKILKANSSKLAKTAGRGTFQSAPLKAMLNDARNADRDGHMVAIILCTDGEDMDMRATIGVAQELARLHNLRVVWVVGADPTSGMASQIRTSLSPLGNRLIVSTADNAGQGLDQFRGIVYTNNRMEGPKNGHES